MLGLVDAGLVVTFATLVGLDGLERVQEGAVVFSRAFGGQWTAAERADRSRLRLVAPWSPIRSAVIAPWTTEAAERDAQVAALVRDGTRAGALEWLGVLHLLLFIIGVPTMVAYWSGAGLIAAVASVLALGLVIGAVAGVEARAAGAVAREAWWVHLGRGLSPFGAASASQLLRRRLAAGLPAVVVARALLAPEAFDAWLRPYAYDHAHRAPDAMLARHVDAWQLQRVRDAVPPRDDPSAASYCPRCAGLFARVEAECPRCGVHTRPFDPA